MKAGRQIPAVQAQSLQGITANVLRAHADEKLQEGPWHQTFAVRLRVIAARIERGAELKVEEVVTMPWGALLEELESR